MGLSCSPLVLRGGEPCVSWADSTLTGFIVPEITCFHNTPVGWAASLVELRQQHFCENNMVGWTRWTCLSHNANMWGTFVMLQISESLLSVYCLHCTTNRHFYRKNAWQIADDTQMTYSNNNTSWCFLQSPIDLTTHNVLFLFYWN